MPPEKAHGGGIQTPLHDLFPLLFPARIKKAQENESKERPKDKADPKPKTALVLRLFGTGPDI
jgi:hypothetical protein